MTRLLRMSTTSQMISPLKGVNCGVARNTSIVDVEGNIYPCHRYEGMKEYIVGNVFTGRDEEATLAYYRKVQRQRDQPLSLVLDPRLLCGRLCLAPLRQEREDSRSHRGRVRPSEASIRDFPLDEEEAEGDQAGLV